MTYHCPDDVLRRAHYFVRQWLSYLEYNALFDVIESFKGEYEGLSKDTKEILEIIVEELIDSIDPLLEKVLIESERYNFLPSEIKTLFESDVNNLLTVNQFLKEAIYHTKAVEKVRTKMSQENLIKKSCYNCELKKLIYSNNITSETN